MGFNRVIFVGLFLIFLSVNVYGMGIGGKELSSKVYFSPNKQISESYNLITTSHQPMDYELFAIMADKFYGKEPEVDLSKYVTFEPSVLKDIKPGESSSFKAMISLPDKIDIPGSHTLYLCARETLASGGMVGSRSAACARVTIIVQYEGKYLLASFNAGDANLNEMVGFKINLENRGKQAIEKVKGTIKVFSLEGKLLDTVYTEEIRILPTSSKQLSAVLDTMGYKPGEYSAEAIIDWDGNTTKLNDMFRIGTLEVGIKNYTAEFEKDKINPFNINIESDWNNHLSNVYALVKLPNGEIQTPTASLKPWEKKKITAYWDTTGLDNGEYNGRITLHFADQTKSNNIKIKIVDKVKKDVEKPVKVMGTFMVILIIIIVLIMGNIIWFVRKKRKEGREDLE